MRKPYTLNPEPNPVRGRPLANPEGPKLLLARIHGHSGRLCCFQGLGFGCQGCETRIGRIGSRASRVHVGCRLTSREVFQQQGVDGERAGAGLVAVSRLKVEGRRLYRA